MYCADTHTQTVGVPAANQINPIGSRVDRIVFKAISTRANRKLGGLQSPKWSEAMKQGDTETRPRDGDREGWGGGVGLGGEKTKQLLEKSLRLSELDGQTED